MANTLRPSAPGFIALVLVCIVLPLFYGSGEAVAQPTHYTFSATGGGVIPTTGSPYIGDAATFGADVALFWQQSDTNVYWHRYWQQPFVGIRANYAHLHNPLAGDRLGMALSFQAPIVRKLDWTYSVGFSFYTNPYRLSHNGENKFIGSVVNCLIDLGVVYNMTFSDSLTLFLAAKLVHSSDAYLYKPNHGLNYLQAELGLCMGPARKRSFGRPADTTFSPYGNCFVMVAPATVTSRLTPRDAISYYFAYSVELGYIRHFHPCFAWGAALDASYNFSHYRHDESPEVPLYPAMSGFADAAFGPWTLRVGLAHYLGHFTLYKTQYYERVGLYYRFGKSFRHYVGVGMKVHSDSIDFMEWTYAIEL